jgi:hypothetical protein
VTAKSKVIRVKSIIFNKKTAWVLNPNVLFYTLLLRKIIIHPTKKAKPKNKSATRENHGKGCPNATARKAWLE